VKYDYDYGMRGDGEKLETQLLKNSCKKINPSVTTSTSAQHLSNNTMAAQASMTPFDPNIREKLLQQYTGEEESTGFGSMVKEFGLFNYIYYEFKSRPLFFFGIYLVLGLSGSFAHSLLTKNPLFVTKTLGNSLIVVKGTTFLTMAYLYDQEKQKIISRQFRTQ